VNYVDNLAANVTETLLNEGVPGQFFTSSGSHSLDMNAMATYRLASNISVNGVVGRRDQSYFGQTYTSTMFGGGVSTAGAFLGGAASGVLRVADYRSGAVAGNPGSSSLSLIASGNYSRDLRRWRFTGNVSYSQNQQTLLISYLTSFYSYGAAVYRPIWKLRWTGAFTGSHSGFVQQAGSGNRSESFSTGLGSRHITFGAGYSTSSGVGVLTPVGITPTSVPTAQQILFGGKNYNFTVGSSPIRRLILSASYSESHGNTTSPTLATSYRTKSMNALVQYRFRQMGFTGGYSRLQQGFGQAAGARPFDGTTFFVGVNRWFDFF
jgi:hypothetical protein